MPRALHLRPTETEDMETPKSGKSIRVIDDDIQHLVQELLARDEVEEVMLYASSEEVRTQIEDWLRQAFQRERNHWKEKLQGTFQEIDRLHKQFIATQASLHELAEEFELVEKEEDHDDQPNDEARVMELVESLRRFIYNLKLENEKTSRLAALEAECSRLKASLSEAQREISDGESRLTTQKKELSWLHKELNSVKYKLSKMQTIAKNYNELHSTNFRLDDVETPRLDNGPNGVVRERTYTEGDHLMFPLPSEEARECHKRAVIKSQESSSTARTRSSQTGGLGIAKCLRCQKLFKLNENNPISCKYHSKGREIKEQYDHNGRLIRVVYKWACCKKGLESPGCSSGCHV